MNRAILTLSISMMASASFASSVACFNRDAIGTKPLVIAPKAADKIEVQFSNLNCVMTKIAYKPNSSKYQGWSRFSPDSKDCEKVSQLIFGTSSLDHRPIGINWLSVSPEALSGLKGFAQLGFRNDADPGAGSVAKANLGCFPDRK